MQHRLPFAPRRTVFAVAATAFLLSACQLHGGGRVDQLNDLRGPTQDVRVELREGTNMAASPSPDGRHLEELTTGPNDDREPAWTPDGSALVSSSDRSNDGQYKIWTVPAAGGPPQQITLGAGAESNPVVSPDGNRLAYVDGANVVTRALAGGAPGIVAPGTAPAWLPDGSGLVYQNADRQLVLRRGAAPSQVTAGEDIFPFPVRFLPDGRFLYTADGHIRVRDAAGRRAHPAGRQ